MIDYKKLNNLNTEMALIGALYSDPKLYVNWAKLINKDLDFTDEYNKFLYDKFETYFMKYLINSKETEISQSQFNLFMTSDEQSKAKYTELGGFDFIKRLTSMADSKLIDGYFDEVRKWSILRVMSEKGFPVEPIMKHPKFEKLGSHHLVQIMQNNLSNIADLAMGSDGFQDVGEGLVALVDECCEKPYIGTPYKYGKYTDYFLGKKKGDLFILLGYLNEGKSRETANWIAYDSLINGENICVIDNEMNVKKTKFAVMTSILNDEAFGYCLNVKEREIKLGQYENEERKLEVKKALSEVESEIKGKIMFKYLHDFSDKNIEFEIRKAKMSKNVDTVYYGTLQSQGKDRSDWSALITTAMLLKSLCEELDIFTVCTAQLTLDSDSFSIFEITMKNIGESKGVAKVADFAVARLKLTEKDKSEFYIKDTQGNLRELPIIDNDDWYYGCKVLKSREGTKPVLVNKVNLNYNTWSEMTELYKGDNNAF